MSLGDYGPRGQRIWLSIMVGVMGWVVAESMDEPLLAYSIVALAVVSILYQSFRVFQADRRERLKWYADEGET